MLPYARTTGHQSDSADLCEPGGTGSARDHPLRTIKALAALSLQFDLMERSFDPTVFTKNHQRFLEHRGGQQLFDEMAPEVNDRSLLSNEHFTVDGTLIKAAASLKSFTRRDGDPPPRTDA